MPTEKQNKIADNIISNLKKKKPQNAGKLLENVGYSKNSAKSPKRVIKSKGVKVALKEKGFDENAAKKVVGKILTGKTSKDESKLKAADMIFKVKGTYAPEKRVSANLNLNAEIKDSPESKKLVDEYNEKLSNMLKKPKKDEK